MPLILARYGGHMPLIPAVEGLRQVDVGDFGGQPSLHSDFQERQSYVERPCLNQRKQNQSVN